jgi:addiction module antidote-like protein
MVASHMVDQPFAPHASLDHYNPTPVDPVDRKDFLCEINPDGSNLLHGLPLSVDSGLGRESLDKAFAPGAKLRDDTVRKLMDSLGVRLTVTTT